MSQNSESKTFEQLLTEADELILQINSDAIKDIKEERRLQVEKHALYLKKIKAEAQARLEEKEASEIGHGAKGMHEAFQEIAKAMRELKSYLS